MTFTRGSSYQGIQFQSGYLVIDQKNSKKFDNYSELMSNLNRQLETDIIVEY